MRERKVRKNMDYSIRSMHKFLRVFLASFFLIPASMALASSFPAPDALPNLEYKSLTTAFPDPSVLTTTQDTLGALDVLRGVTSATLEFQTDLLSVAQNAKILDSTHLALIADGVFFPWMSYQAMVQFISDPRVCENVSYSVCQTKLAQVRKNQSLAVALGQSLNQILATGLTKVSSLNYVDGLALLQRVFPAALSDSEMNNLSFKNAMALLPSLDSDQKFHLMRLAQKKSALSAAKSLAVSWFTANSDHEATTLIDLLNSFPSPALRDSVFFEAVSSVHSLSSAQAKVIILAAQDQMKTALACLEKTSSLTPKDVTDIANLLNKPEDRNQWLTAGVQKLGLLTAADALTIVRQGSPVSAQIAAQALALVSELTGTQLALITESVAYGPDRDQLILNQLQRITHVTAKEGSVLTRQAQGAGLHIALLSLKKVVSPQASDLVQIVDGLRYGPFRDLALVDGSNLVMGADFTSVQIAIKQAYNEKIQVMSILVKKLPRFSTVDLAALALDLYAGSLRDQILLTGSKFLTDLNIAGLVAMVNQADQQKFQVAYTIFSRMNQLSARDFGVVLKVISDGTTRDQLISVVFPMLKKVDAVGAAMIVDASQDYKVQFAMRLFKMIPSVTGFDLDKMLAVCGSGIIRDQILAQAVPLLVSLTKEEAKALHSRAYNNKDDMAVLLMGKVADFDGTTIAEMAALSGRASSRDRIIAEGLKRLKQVDVAGLIAMIKVADKMVEKLAFEVVTRVPHYSADNAMDIFDVLPMSFQNRFLIVSVGTIENIDEPAITELALATTDQATRDQIISKGIDRMGGGE